MPKHFVTLQLAIVLLILQSPRLALGEPSVGVYYYPWYGSFSGGHRVDQSLRGHLDPPQPPAIGDYSNRDAATISAHIDQSHQGNVDFWAVSWWGPTSAENITFRDSILAHPRRAELEYAVHYESTGRLGTFENPSFHNLIPDFRYLADNYFDDPNYLRIDDRPVVFMYVTRAYFNSQASRDAVSELRSTMIAEFGVDPYIVGDDLFGGGVDLQRAQLWDAITDFDVYGTVLQGGGSTAAALSELAGVYDDAREAIADLDVGFIPGASPGFNDKGVRDGHPAAPRYLVDDPNATEGGLFAKMLNEVVVPRTDPRANHILMINSFNEWHEDTQIEPTIVAARTNIDDSGSQYYSEGHFYEGYGNLYLDILRAATIIPGDYSGNGAVDAADYTIWRDSVGQTGLGRIADGNHDAVVNQLDHGVWFANFGTSTSGSSSSYFIPEPTTLVLLALASLFFGIERFRWHFAV